ncbi:hypothetical protein GCM10010116_39180 [Microbispora rosea subsp. aerata]|nr:hypothetical protein [Microbispora rosea]GGO19498.1 hypothetical protein GCM10010116_39180 [Microbispora rosea subsp. aerata]GIH54401.1 hypothetical protein Mro02_13150 [Microbispora rosea subsp. aerata]GLJ81373.1 hypothetical protein GCM10017588_00960 [Microbispora rosea subsp. aerata]
MAQDTRRVQTAVLGSPDSDHPLSLPTDRKEAAHYLSRYKGKRFFCGRHLGGCGWELMPKLYGDRVCHFAHHPDPKGVAPICERRYSGPDSADHLYIHRGLTTGLGKAGVAQPFRGTLVKGQCTDLLVNPGRNRSAIKVQFVNLPPDVWTKEDEELRARLGRVDWLLGPYALGNAKYLLNRDGYALRVRCEQQGSTRVVKIGTETRDGDLEWSELKDCDISEQGIITPLLRKRRPTTTRLAASTTRFPGFPLDVEDIVIYPQEASTRPIAGPGIPEGSHVAAADVRIGEGEPIPARIMVPSRVDLLVGEPYALVKPASVNAMKGVTHATPVWTVFSAGLSTIRPAGPPNVSLSQALTPRPTPASPVPVSAPQEKKTRSPEQFRKLIRHVLTSLIQDMRLARREGDYRLLLRLLADNDESLKVLRQPQYRKERETVEELRRWAAAREETNALIERDVRRQSAALIEQIDRARASGKLEDARHKIDALRKTLVRVSTGNPKFGAEVRKLREREAWLEKALAERDRADRARAAAARAESVRAKHHDRLREVLDQLLKAEIAGETDEVRKLYNEGRSLLRKLGAHATPSEKRQLSLTAQWLSAVPTHGRARDENSAGESEEISASASHELAVSNAVTMTTTDLKQATTDLRTLTTQVGDRLSGILRKVARDQSTISLRDLAQEVGADDWLCVIALVEVDEAAGSEGPLLSALVTSPDAKACPEFCAVLAGLGYEVPQTDRALDIVWRREVARTHAFYAASPRDMPPRLVPVRTVTS